MRILMITNQIPYPPISGTPLRNYHIIRRLSRKHEVWLAAFATSNGEQGAVEQMLPYCHDIVTSQSRQIGALGLPLEALRYLLRDWPVELRMYDSPDLARKIRELISKVHFDVIDIIDSYMGLYLETLREDVRPRAVLTFIDVVFKRCQRITRLEPHMRRRLRLWVYGSMMRRWEPRYAQRFQRCIAVSDADRDLLLSLNPKLNITVIPNGVDTRLYQPTSRAVGLNSLLFVGNMDYRPNIDAMKNFCEEMLPIIRRSFPVDLWIVGVNPSPELRQLEGPGIHITGGVNDLRPYYERSAVCIVPLRAGGGTRLKILEAMALGRPVVSTSIGSEGLGATDGKQLLTADTPESFAAKTIALLTDSQLRDRIIGEARKFVVNHYDWDLICANLVHLYEEVAGARP